MVGSSDEIESGRKERDGKPHAVDEDERGKRRQTRGEKHGALPRKGRMRERRRKDREEGRQKEAAREKQ